jgi:hypothetical protein
MFDDSAPWPTSPDGDGKSLVIIDPLGDASSAVNWRASYYDGGSPGRDDLPIPGDFLTDGVVDQADYAAWKTAFGDAATHVGHGADGNGDGMIDIADYTVWRNNVGAMYEAPGAGGGAGSGSLAVAATFAEASAPLRENARQPWDLAFTEFGREPSPNRIGLRFRESHLNRSHSIARDHLLLVSRIARPALPGRDIEHEPCRAGIDAGSQSIELLDGPLDQALAGFVTDRWVRN